MVFEWALNGEESGHGIEQEAHRVSRKSKKVVVGELEELSVSTACYIFRLYEWKYRMLILDSTVYKAFPYTLPTLLLDHNEVNIY